MKKVGDSLPLKELRSSNSVCLLNRVDEILHQSVTLLIWKNLVQMLQKLLNRQGIPYWLWKT